MYWDRVEGNWRQFKGNIRERWGHITNDPFAVIEGKRENLAGMIQKSYGMTRERAGRQVGDGK